MLVPSFGLPFVVKFLTLYSSLWCDGLYSSLSCAMGVLACSCCNWTGPHWMLQTVLCTCSSDLTPVIWLHDLLQVCVYRCVYISATSVLPVTLVLGPAQPIMWAVVTLPTHHVTVVAPVIYLGDSSYLLRGFCSLHPPCHMHRFHLGEVRELHPLSPESGSVVPTTPHPSL